MSNTVINVTKLPYNDDRDRLPMIERKQSSNTQTDDRVLEGQRDEFSRNFENGKIINHRKQDHSISASQN